MYILDTTAVSNYLRGNKGIIDRFRTTSLGIIYTTSITKFELEYGLTKNPKLRLAYVAQLDLLFQQISCLDFDQDTAMVAAAVKHQLFTDKTPISIEDLMIGAIALQYHFAVVTSNTKHFEKIKGLVLENWKS